MMPTVEEGDARLMAMDARMARIEERLIRVEEGIVYMREWMGRIEDRMITRIRWIILLLMTTLTGLFLTALAIYAAK